MQSWIGVTRHSAEAWRATVQIQGQQFFLGRGFRTAEAAARAVDRATIAIEGRDAVETNFLLSSYPPEVSSEPGSAAECLDAPWRRMTGSMGTGSLVRWKNRHNSHLCLTPKYAFGMRRRTGSLQEQSLATFWQTSANRCAIEKHVLTAYLKPESSMLRHVASSCRQSKGVMIHWIRHHM